MLAAVLRHLEALVSFDTRNPPRLIGTGGIFDYIRAHLPGFRIDVSDHGDGAVSLFAVRGNPRRVFNVHLDTVPSSEAWSADPHVMRRFDDRVVGLGVCDINGAAAGLVAAAKVTQGHAAFLVFTPPVVNLLKDRLLPVPGEDRMAERRYIFADQAWIFTVIDEQSPAIGRIVRIGARNDGATAIEQIAMRVGTRAARRL